MPAPVRRYHPPRNTLLRRLGGSTVVLCLWFTAAQAQEWTVLRSYTTRDGLSQNVVNCGLQDSKGFLWIGTRYGLNRFDGRVFRVYHHRPGDASSISDDEITALLEDDRGVLWVGTKAGLNRLDRRMGVFQSVTFLSQQAYAVEHPAITCIVAEPGEGLWIGTNEGLFQLYRGTDTAREVSLPRRHGLLSNRVYVVFREAAHTILVVRNDGIQRIHENRGSRNPLVIRSDENIAGPRAVFRWSANTMLFGNVGDTALAFYNQASTRVDAVSLRLPNFPRVAWFGQFLRTSSGAVLACTNNGLLEMDSIRRRKGAYECQARVLQPGATICAFEDDQGNVWVGGTAGLVMLSRKRNAIYAGRLFGEMQQTLDNTIRCFYSDHAGGLFVGSIYGLHAIGRKPPFISPCVSHDQPRWDHGFRDAVNAVYEDEDGTLLLCGPGIQRYRQGERNAQQMLRGDEMRFGYWCLLRVDPDHIWAGTAARGIVVLDRSYAPVAHLLHDPTRPGSLSDNSIHDIHRDYRGNIWVATNGGLNRWNPIDSTFFRYTHDPGNPNSIGNNRVWVLMEDSKKNLWAGTYGGGLARYRPESDDFVRITDADGLPNNAVFGILEDGRGRLWISTEAGLTCYDPSNGSWRSINDPNVKQYRDFGFKAFHRTRSGEMLFGGSWGYIRFFPDSVRSNPRVPRVVISGVRLFEKSYRHELRDGDTLEVAYADKILAFEFAALDYHNPQLNRYAYKLEGFTREWIQLGTRREAVFTNLDPGTYTLRVRGSNNDGVWNMAGMAVVLVVQPPVHMTWWFRLLSALLLLGAAAAVVRARVRGVHRRERMERRLVASELQSLRLQMNPHFIFNSLNAVQSFMLTAEYAQANAYLTKFARLIRTILEHSRVSTVRIGDELDFLSSYMELERLRFSDRFRWEMTVDASVNRDLYIPSMLVQPHVENAIRHGLAHKHGGGFLQIHVAADARHVTITVRDNGIGRARAAALQAERGSARSSLGVSVTEERLAILQAHGFPGARLDIEDLAEADGKAAGTSVTVVVPVVPPHASHASHTVEQ